jgi:hypothetical protein
MKQTAVEWLMQTLEQNNIIDLDWVDNDKYYTIIEQAKEMEEEQIIAAHIEGQRVFDKHPHTQWTNDQAEQYYDETFGGNNEQ